MFLVAEEENSRYSRFSLPLLFNLPLLFLKDMGWKHTAYHIIKGTLKILREILISESPLKMMKNAFYFTLKALFILKMFKFCHDFLVM